MVGRYTIIHSPQTERDTMLLDTTTGDTWQLVTMGKDESDGMGWQFVGKIDQPPPWDKYGKSGAQPPVTFSEPK